jgi:preprotein translocase subunit SecF
VAILPVISMLVVGGHPRAVTLEEFAIALLIGMISGAHSSIFIAAPIVVCSRSASPQPARPSARPPAGSPAVEASRSEALRL